MLLSCWAHHRNEEKLCEHLKAETELFELQCSGAAAGWFDLTWVLFFSYGYDNFTTDDKGVG